MNLTSRPDRPQTVNRSAKTNFIIAIYEGWTKALNGRLPVASMKAGCNAVIINGVVPQASQVQCACMCPRMSTIQ